MYVTIVDVWVKPDCLEDFIKASETNHLASIQEAENLRFDVLQNHEDPCKFVLYEAYKTQQGATDHKETQHYLTWRETVADMMTQPRKGYAHTSIKP